MSYANFSVSFKSTIDFLAKGVADAKGLPFLDLASSAFDAAIVESDQPAIFWDLTSIQESPFDPMYSANFEIGAMTMLDPSQYISLEIIGAVADVFKVGESYDIMNYSADVLDGVVVGKFTIIGSGMAPAQQDESTNVRTISVQIMAVRYE